MMTMQVIGMDKLQQYVDTFGDKTLLEFRRENERTARAMQQEYIRGVKENFRTGTLEKSIKYDTDDDFMSVEVGSTAEHAIYLEFGTRAHTITPKFSRFLRFFWPKVGKVVYMKRVKHPGTKAVPALLMSWIKFMEPVESTFIRRLEERLNRL